MAVQATPNTLNLTLSAEHEELRRVVREFARREILPVAAHYDETGEFPMAIVRKMGEMGLMGIEVPEEYGGAGMDTIAYVLTMEEIAKADAATSTILSVNNSLVCHGLLKFGTEAQKQKYLRDVASGAKIGAYSLTEPMSGSDAGNMKSRAILSEDGTHYIINGRKSWVTSGPVADYVILFTMTEPEKRHHGITAFIIETDKPGFAAGKKEPKLGIRASATSELIFEDYRCPVENVLGEVGQGFKIAMNVLDAGRIGIAAQALGIAEAAYEASVEYARQREAFGAPIGSFQMIQAKIADMKTRIEASRLLIYNAALAKERAKHTGARYTTEASMAKLFASETAMFCAHAAVQIHGGMGYSRELPIERYFRDAKITEIYEGTSEIQRLVIARNELGLR
ncbi:MAG: acyl-CoA dehydrogenase [Candidatus Thermofonsia Clade 1 bacterium]|jgi:alkylation response protein AidB-like acyl-CoA dehydrogenase|uniref:Acyl-CoA dehydrogenase n=1 Tax=Candidatus Thermofonsia Clade 1 bacterium TaxID=2364210 RepID=A0A2M8PZI2_9CHLR|nr:MAG: acyl-CoA dehydrogenase [Candidatus Thermofonsia Clade 1 bacterium]PJF42933.1 MAG: acyl-CoA dehydrogenase [Candidatus Thermofonsia Clade 1 bacterium]RMF49303.1 MAG: acyl-CoA dehydrogenase [Chloroflexota bacterium]